MHQSVECTAQFKGEALKFKKVVMLAGAVLAGLAVVLGAFGAHGLKSYLSPYELGVFKTGVTYQMYHALALLALGVSGVQSWLIFGSFFMGVLFFSGSLYLLTLLHVPAFGMVTPIGGALFVLGWVVFCKKIMDL